MKLDKNLIGKIIYGKPTGNAARGGSATYLQKFKVDKIGRKYIKLFNVYSDGSLSNRSDSYCPSTGATQSQINSGYGGNSGYTFFNNEDEVKLYNDTLLMRGKIRHFFSYKTTLNHKQCVDILKIIEADNETK